LEKLGGDVSGLVSELKICSEKLRKSEESVTDLGMENISLGRRLKESENNSGLKTFAFENLEKEFENFITEKNGLFNELKTLSQDYDRKKELLEVRDSEIEELKAKLREYDNSNHNLTLSVENSEKAAAANLKTQKKLEAGLTESEEHFNTLEKRLRDREDEILESHKANQQLKTDIGWLETELESLQRAKSALTSEIGQLRERMKNQGLDLEDSKKVNERMLNDLKNLESENSALKRAREANENEISSLRDRLRSRESEIEKVAEELANCRIQNSELNSRIRNFETEFGRSQKLLSEEKISTKSLTDEVHNIDSIISELETKLSDHKLLIDNLEQEKSGLTKANMSLNSQSKSDEDAIFDLNAILTAKNSEFELLDENMAGLRRVNGELLAAIKAGEEDHERLGKFLVESEGEVSGTKDLLSGKESENFDLKGRLEALGKELLESESAGLIGVRLAEELKSDCEGLKNSLNVKDGELDHSREAVRCEKLEKGRLEDGLSKSTFSISELTDELAASKGFNLEKCNELLALKKIYDSLEKDCKILQNEVKNLTGEVAQRQKSLDEGKYELKLKVGETDRLRESNSELRKELSELQAAQRSKEMDNQKLKGELSGIMTSLKAKDLEAEKLGKLLAAEKA
jgi:chromosome segregation ATPase